MASFESGYEPTPIHKARVRAAACRRGATDYPRIKVGNTVYSNILAASRATGVSPRSISRYIKSALPEHKDYKQLPPLKATGD